MRSLGWVLALGLGLGGLPTLAELGCTALAGLNGYEVVPQGGGAGGAAGSGAQAGGGAGGMAGSGAQAGGGAGGGLLGNGELCDSPSQCTSSHCVDDVCCDDACGGKCEACTAAKTGVADGTCAPVVALTDPDGECTPTPTLGCDGTAAGDCAACGAAAPPPGSASCPADCNGGCVDNVCTIDTTADNQFQGRAIDCPADYACAIICDTNRGCDTATINCPDRYACTVTCTDSQHKCEGAVVYCPDKGTCTIACQGGDTCTNTQVICGANDCVAACTGTGSTYPALTPLPGGGCAPTGC